MKMLFGKTNRTFLRAYKITLHNARLCSINIKETLANDSINVPGRNIEEKVLKVSVIGMPNSGKSTFINALMDRRVCPASCKAHTTRTKSRAIFTSEESQVVFMDTPGLINDKEQKKFKLDGTFLRDPKRSTHEADVIGVIHDVSNSWTRESLDIKIINLLEKHILTPSFLVLNKIDMLKSKRKLLDITRVITENHINGKLIPGSQILKPKEGMKGFKHFKDVFMVSALTGDGLKEVKDYLMKQAKPGKWMYPADVWSDQSPETLILNSVKAQLLNYLPQEIPYLLQPVMELFEVSDEGMISAVVIVLCPSEKKRQLVAGDQDGKLRQIIQSVQKDLQAAFLTHVRLQIVLEVKNKKA